MQCRIRKTALKKAYFANRKRGYAVTYKGSDLFPMISQYLQSWSAEATHHLLIHASQVLHFLAFPLFQVQQRTKTQRHGIVAQSHAERGGPQSDSGAETSGVHLRVVALPGQGAGGRPEVRHQGLPEEAGRAADPAHPRISRSADTEVDSPLFGHFVLRGGYFSVVRNGEQVQ